MALAAAIVLSCAGSPPTLRFIAPSSAPPNSQSRPELVVQAGLGGETMGSVFSRDNRLIAASDRSETLVVWDATSGRVVLRVPAAGTVEDWSPDGATIATRSERKVRLWDAATGTSKGELEATRTILEASFNHDGTRLAVAVGDAGVVVWNVARRKVDYANADSKSLVDNFAWHPKRDLLSYKLDGGEGRKVRTVDVDLGTSGTLTLGGKVGYVVSLAYEASGKLLAFDTTNTQLVELPSEVARPLDPAGAHGGGVVRFSSDASKVVARLGEDTMAVWEVATGRLLGKTKPGARDEKSDGEHFQLPNVANDGRVAARGDSEVTLSDPTGKAPPLALRGTEEILSLEWDGSGRHLLSSTHDASQLWDSATGRATFLVAPEGRRRVAVSADGATSAYLTDDAIEIERAGAQLERRSFKADPGTLHRSFFYVFSPDGRRLAYLSGGIFVLDTSSGKELWNVQDQKSRREVRYTNDGKRITSVNAATYPEGKVVPASVDIFDAETGVVKTITGKGSSVAAANGDGSLAAFCGGDPDTNGDETYGGTTDVRLVDVASGADVGSVSIGEAKARVTACAVSGNAVATAVAVKGEWTIRVFDRTTQRELARLPFASMKVPAFALDAQGRFLAVGGSTIELTRLADKAKLSLHTFKTPSGHADLATTDDGVFDGDDAAFAKVLYRLGGTLVSADQLFERFHTPNLLSKFLGGGSVAAKTEVASGVGPPPRVEIVGAPAEASSDQISIHVRAFDQGGGVSDVRVFANGARADQGRGLELEATATTERTVVIALVPGDNEIWAEAYNVQGKVRSARVVAKVRRIAAEAPVRPDLYLLSVSLNEYEDPALTLGYSNADGDAVAKAFETQQGKLFGKVSIKRLKDKQATKEAITSHIDALSKTAKPEDVFVFFAAGHGTMLACDGGSARYQLLTYESTLRKESTICKNSFADVALAELLRKVPAQKKVLILDTCQAGGAATGEVLTAARGAEEVDAIKRLARSEGMAIIAAAKPTEYAREVKSLGHGIFSYALIEGLGGKATKDRSAITVFGLIAYLDDEVEALSRTYFNRPQYPISSTQGQNFALAMP